jgi:hypothetical protein
MKRLHALLATIVNVRAEILCPPVPKRKQTFA